MKREVIDFRTEKVSVLFKKLFYPTLIGMLSISAITIADGIFVGRGVGSDGIAAVNICIPLLMALTGVGLMIGVGNSVMSSIYLSKNKPLMARASVTQALLFVTIITSIVLFLIFFFPEKTARLLGSSDHLLPMVIDYLLWFAPGILFQLWVVVGMFALRLDGAPQLAMWCSIVTALVNLVLDWLFIFPFGWGVMGAAFASTLACVCGSVIIIVYLLFYARDLRLHTLRLNRRGVNLFFRHIGEQCKIGSSALLGEATMAILMFAGNLSFMHYLGDDGVAAFGISCYYLPFVFMIGNSIAQSAQPIISYNFGIGAQERVRSALRISLVTAACYGIIAMAAFTLLPDLLVNLFLTFDNAAARIASVGFPYYGTAFVFFILNLSVIGYYQSIESVKSAFVFALLRGFIFLIPCFVLLPMALSTKGLWLALPLSECLTTVCILFLFVLNKRRPA